MISTADKALTPTSPSMAVSTRNPALQPLARELKCHMTETEHGLWYLLRGKRLQANKASAGRTAPVS